MVKERAKGSSSECLREHFDESSPPFDRYFDFHPKRLFSNLSILSSQMDFPFKERLGLVVGKESTMPKHQQAP